MNLYMPTKSVAELKTDVEAQGKALGALTKALPAAVERYRAAYDRAAAAEERAKELRAEADALEQQRSDLIRDSVAQDKLSEFEATLVSAKQRAQTLRDAAAAQTEVAEVRWGEANKLHEELRLADERIKQAHRAARRALYDLAHAEFVLGTIKAMKRLRRALLPDVYARLPEMVDILEQSQRLEDDGEPVAFPGEAFGIPADAPTSGVR